MTQSSTPCHPALAELLQSLKGPVPATLVGKYAALTGLATDQSRRHLQLGRWFDNRLAVAPPEQAPPTAIQRTVWAQYIEALLHSSYANSTRITLVGSMIGATKRMSTIRLVLSTTPPAVHDVIAVPAMVQDAIRTMKKQGRSEQVFNTVEATPSTVTSLLNNIACPEQYTYVYLMWICAARSTSIAALRIIDVQVDHLYLATATIRFRQGKTAATTGTYAVHVPLTATAQQHLATLISQAKSPATDFLFGTQRNKTASQVSALLRKAQLCVRAFRRGALRAMAREGVDTTTLLLFSRHTSAGMLYAYLNGGSDLRHEADVMLPAAAHLI